MTGRQRGIAWRGACILALVATVGCGGGGGGGGPATPPTVLYSLATSMGALDGWVSSTGGYSASGFLPPRVGDLDAATPGTRVRSYFTFDVSSLPPGAQIRKATLSIRVTGSSGDPFGQLGNLVARWFPYGGDLANVFTAVVTNPPSPSTFSPANTQQDWKEADVTGLLRRCQTDGLTRLQVEVDFDGAFTVVNGIDDVLGLGDGEDLAGQGHAPSLLYSYTQP